MSTNFRNLARAILITVSLLASAKHGNAASYFVDYGSGNDSSDGTSTSTPWQHCPGDSLATSTAASTTLAAGDTVFFKGGVTYLLPHGILLNWAGTSGNPITYDGNSAGTYGTGRAIITDNFGTNGVGAFGGNITNLSFNSFIFQNIGGSNAIPQGNFSPHGVPPKPGYGIACSSVNGLYIANCYFGELGYYQNYETNIGNSSLAGQAFVVNGDADNVIITNCELTQIRDPIGFNGGHKYNIAIANCFFHDQMEWAITMTCVNSYRSNVYIHDCVFSNTDQYYVDQTQGGLWVSKYDTGGPHENCIMMFNAEGSGGASALDRFPGDTNVFIYNNKFLTTMGKPGGTTSIWIQDGTSGYIYNNLFYLTTANNAVVLGDFATNTPTDIGVYNNTFYCGTVAIGVSGANGGANWPCVATNIFINIKNNIISTLNIGNNNAFDWNINTTSMVGPSKNAFFNYNDYFSDQILSGNNMIYGLSSSGGYNPTPAGWNVNSVTALPQFVNATHSSPFNYDLHLQANSPAINAGVNLTSLGLPGLNFDADGNPRPATGPWTIGAYQVTSTAPFVSLVASPGTINSGQTATLTWMSINATNLVLNGVGQVALNGTTNVSPTKTTSYVITATGTNGTWSATFSVLVRPSPPVQLPPH